MFGKREIYTGKDDDRLKDLLSRLDKAGIKYQISRDIPHSADVTRGAAVGRYGETTQASSVSVHVKKADYESALELLKQQ